MRTSKLLRPLRPRRSVVILVPTVRHLTLDMVQVEKANETAQKIDVELKDLQVTLANIEEARPFEDLTVSLLHCQRTRVLILFVDI